LPRGSQLSSSQVEEFIPSVATWFVISLRASRANVAPCPEAKVDAGDGPKFQIAKFFDKLDGRAFLS
jgi:hypothetical protein